MKIKFEMTIELENGITIKVSECDPSVLEIHLRRTKGVARTGTRWDVNFMGRVELELHKYVKDILIPYIKSYLPDDLVEELKEEGLWNHHIPWK